MSHNIGGEKLRKPSSKGNISRGVSLLCTAAALVCTACGAACAFYFGGAALLVIIALGVFGAVSSAMLLCYGEKLFRAVPALALAASVPFGAAGILFAVTVTACGVCVSACVGARRKRFETVLWLTVCVCVCLALAFVISAFEFADAGSKSVVVYVGHISDAVSEYYGETMKELEAVFEETGGIPEEYAKQFAKLSSDDAIKSFGKSFTVSAPAYVAAGVSVLCYGIFSLFLAASVKTGNKLYAFRIFAIPPLLAHLFILFSFVSVFVSAETVVGLLLRYITVLFTPCFAYLGARSVGALLRSRAPVGIRIAAAVICICLIPMFTYLITLLAFLGAYLAMRMRIEIRVKKK